MPLPANLNVYISAFLFIMGAYLVALYAGLIVWTARDIRARSRDLLAQIMAILLVAVFNVPGLIIYLLMRPHSKLAEEYERSLVEEAVLHDLEERHTCPECQHYVEPDFIICPYCLHQLKLRCEGCGRLLNPTWQVCPYCGRFRDKVEESHSQRAETLSSLEGPIAEPALAPEGRTTPEDPNPS
ncbi:MAG: zinc ribbon domain-containing protein [Chloroflexi bacterium]|nr:zinc ribbon domain-containing protein [Chloroflexota bacterium]